VVQSWSLLPCKVDGPVTVLVLSKKAKRLDWTRPSNPRPEAPKNTRPLGPVDDEVLGWMGLYVHYIQQKPKKKKKKSKATQKREEDALSSDKPYELKEIIDEAASMLTEGPQEEPSSTKEEMLSGMPTNNVPMEQG